MGLVYILSIQILLFATDANYRYRYCLSIPILLIDIYVNTRRIRILVLRRIQKSVHYLRSMGNIQNGATVMRRDREETNCSKKSLFLFSLCAKLILVAS